VSNGAPPVAEEGCALKTITRALQIIGTPVLPTTIEVVGGAVGAGETFPLVIPANVTITTKANSGAVTVTVPANKVGFTLGSPASAIQGSAGSTLTITTTAATPGTVGVLVNGTAGGNGTAAQETTLANVTINGLLDHGIEVEAGILNIGAGVVSENNGTATTQGDGLLVSGGEAVINAPAGSTATTFNDNSAHGILVTGTGFVVINGVVTTAATGVGTVETNGNGLAGVWVEQTAGGAANPPKNLLNGLASFGNTGHGMRIVAGSQVIARGSAFLGNTGDGVIISAASIAADNSLVGIDLGDINVNGANTFQATGAAANKAAGICVDVNNQAAPLLAQGNQFQASNCANPGGGALFVNPRSCQNTCVGGANRVCDLGFINPESAAMPSTNTANVSSCTE
jgi:hypothetical protein